MRYPSPIRILLHAGTPAQRVLLEWDTMIGAIPASDTSQAGGIEQFVGAQWAGLDALGNGNRTLQVETAELLDDAAAAVVEMLDDAAAVEPGVQGLRIELANPMLGPGYSPSTRVLVRWDCADAVIAAGSSSVEVGGVVRRSLQATIGDAVATIPDHEPEAIPEGILQVLSVGIREHDGQKWYRVECQMPDDYEGDAATGWTNGTLRVDLEWSVDLATWATGHCQASPEADVIAGGKLTTWAESKHPQDCGILTSDQIIRWEAPANVVTWTLAQDIEWLRFQETNVDLPNFPYAMPGDAATLQADLRAAGFTGAEVEVDGGSAWWEIRLYDVETTGYAHNPGGYVNPGYEYATRDGTQWNNTLRGRYENPRFGPELDPFVIYKKQFIRGRVTKA
jgi:hypothetical protein